MRETRRTIIIFSIAIVAIVALWMFPALRCASDDASAAEKRSQAESKIASRGAIFELLVPERAWVIPAEEDGARTPVALELRISNQSDRPLRFSRFDTIFVRVNGPDGKPLHPDGGRNQTLPAHASDFPLVAPGESTMLAIDAQLFWRDGQLRFGGSDGFGGIWGFSEALRAGHYQVSVHYENNRDKAEVTEETAPGERVRTGFWTGAVDTPSINVSLVNPHMRTVVKRAPDGPGPDENVGEADNRRTSGADGIDLGGEKMVVYVARDKQTWDRVQKEAGPPHPFPNGARQGTSLATLDRVDFERQMIVAVFWGRMNFAGRDEKCWIESVSVGENEVTVDCHANLWGGEIFRSYQAWPYSARVVANSDLPVSFVQTVEYRAKPDRSIRRQGLASLKPGEWRQELQDKPENSLPPAP